MKNERQQAILELIAKENIETQEELAAIMFKKGFRSTQATISRDIKDLHLIKVHGPKGKYRYALNMEDRAAHTIKMRIYRDVVMSVDVAATIVVIKTRNGSAGVAAEALESMDYPEMVGCVAGDNTIFVAFRTGDDAIQFAQDMEEVLK